MREERDEFNWNAWKTILGMRCEGMSQSSVQVLSHQSNFFCFKRVNLTAAQPSSKTRNRALRALSDSAGNWKCRKPSSKIPNKAKGTIWIIRQHFLPPWNSIWSSFISKRWVGSGFQESGELRNHLHTQNAKTAGTQKWTLVVQFSYNQTRNKLPSIAPRIEECITPTMPCNSYKIMISRHPNRSWNYLWKYA